MTVKHGMQGKVEVRLQIIDVVVIVVGRVTSYDVSRQMENALRVMEF